MRVMIDVPLFSQEGRNRSMEYGMVLQTRGIEEAGN